MSYLKKMLLHSNIVVVSLRKDLDSARYDWHPARRPVLSEVKAAGGLFSEFLYKVNNLTKRH
jgi:hypothetical protein